MTTNTDDHAVQWVSERDITRRTGLPGPVIAAVLPHLPTPPNGYSDSQPLYTADSIQRAQLATLLLRAGIRQQFIRSAVADLSTPEQLNTAITRWTPLADKADPPPPWWHQHRTLSATLLALTILGALLITVLLLSSTVATH